MSRRRLHWRHRLLQVGQTWADDHRSAREQAIPKDLSAAIGRLMRADKWAPSQRRQALVHAWFGK